MANRVVTYTNGNVLSAANLDDEVNNVYTGTIDRTAGRWGSNDDIPLTLGNSQDCRIEFDTGQTNDALMVTVDNVSRSIIICEEADAGTNFAIANQTNPTLFIHSADATVAADYLRLYHDQTDGVVTTGAGNLVLNSASGAIMINETTDANMTIGLCINQGANDNAILTLKSSDVAHGITDNAETDTYLRVQKYNATEGGVSWQAYGEGTTADHFFGAHTVDNVAKTTAAVGVHIISGALRSGTAAVACGADANILVVRNLATARFIFDAEGSFHADVESTTFDAYDDLALLGDFEAHIANSDKVKEGFSGFLKYNREALEAANIVHFDNDNRGHAMINLTRLAMLQCGAIRQLNEKFDRLERVLEA